MKIAFLGAGNMAKALIKGFLKAEAISPQDLIVTSKSGDSARTLAQEYGIHQASSNNEAIMAASVVFLCTKPAQALEVLTENALALKEKLIISVAAGLCCEDLFYAAGKETRVIRTMPNTAVRVGKGVTPLTPHSSATIEDLDLAQKLFSAVGITFQVEEKYLHAVTAVSGSGPAFALLFLEGLMTGGITHGLKPSLARALAAHTLEAAAALILETEDSPAALRAQIASPKGTTEAGLKVLEEQSLLEIVHASVQAATQRSKEIAEQK
ncbi:MAG: pyrroline-5-carboxylate reductase [Chthoniobacterales bacterium]|nr:pyrroline-5-carboxylate reductase [Chthoniobacterales bacterium]